MFDNDVKGGCAAWHLRALGLAAVGGDNLLMAAPPGVGKTMLARRLAGLLPALDEETALEVTACTPRPACGPVPAQSGSNWLAPSVSPT